MLVGHSAGGWLARALLQREGREWLSGKPGRHSWGHCIFVKGFLTGGLFGYQSVKICQHLSMLRTFLSGSRGKQLHTRNHKLKIHWTMPLKIHWTFPETFTGQVAILWEMPLTSEIPLENAAESPLGDAIENPRGFPRCRFLVCNLLPLGSRGTCRAS